MNQTGQPVLTYSVKSMLEFAVKWVLKHFVESVLAYFSGPFVCLILLNQFPN